jgi:hypothetical protein
VLCGIRTYQYDYTNDDNWDYTESPGDGRDYHAYASAGDYTVKLQVWDHDSCYGLGSDKSAWCTAPVTAVEVDKIQYLDPEFGYTDISATLYVHKGTTVTFKAMPNPSDASWPSGKPVWGGTAGASGPGLTVQVAFNTLSSNSSDYKTVWAECGTSRVTANIIVYDFDGELDPDDNFSGRSEAAYGIGETVDLRFETTPSGITATQAGGLEWTKDSGVGTVSNAGDDGTADYEADDAIQG